VITAAYQPLGLNAAIILRRNAKQEKRRAASDVNQEA